MGHPTAYYELRSALAKEYRDSDAWWRIATELELKPETIKLNGSSRTVWANILFEVKQKNKYEALIKLITRDCDYILPTANKYVAQLKSDLNFSTDAQPRELNRHIKPFFLKHWKILTGSITTAVGALIVTSFVPFATKFFDSLLSRNHTVVLSAGGTPVGTLIEKAILININDGTVFQEDIIKGDGIVNFQLNADGLYRLSFKRKNKYAYATVDLKNFNRGVQRYDIDALNVEWHPIYGGGFGDIKHQCGVPRVTVYFDHDKFSFNSEALYNLRSDSEFLSATNSSSGFIAVLASIEIGSDKNAVYKIASKRNEAVLNFLGQHVESKTLFIEKSQRYIDDALGEISFSDSDTAFRYWRFGPNDYKRKIDARMWHRKVDVFVCWDEAN